MYGHGAAPPTRTSGTVITLRVLFVIAGFLSCGLLSCLSLFRVAVLRGRRTDWLLAWISLPVAIGCLAVVGSVPESDHRGDVALALVLILGAFSVPTSWCSTYATTEPSLPSARTAADGRLPAAPAAAAGLRISTGPPAVPGGAASAAVHAADPATAASRARPHRPGTRRTGRTERLPSQARGR